MFIMSYKLSFIIKEFSKPEKRFPIFKMLLENRHLLLQLLILLNPVFKSFFYF